MSHTDNHIEEQISHMLEKVLEEENCLSSLNLSDKLTDVGSNPPFIDRTHRKALTTKETSVKLENILLNNNFPYPGYNKHEFPQFSPSPQQFISPSLSHQGNNMHNLYSYYQQYNPNGSQQGGYEEPLSSKASIQGNYHINNYIPNNSLSYYQQSSSQQPYFNPEHKRSQRRNNTFNTTPIVSVPDPFSHATSSNKSPFFSGKENFMTQDLLLNLQGGFNDFVPHKMRARKLINNEMNCFISNEFDEILDSHMKLNEKIDEDFYRKLRGNLFKILTTQNGSRVLQKCLKRTCQDVLSLLLEELKYSIHELMVDPYANYFCQKFFGLLTDKDKLIFLTNVKQNILYISNNKIGTYPLQVVIEQLRKQDEKQIMIESVRQCCMEMFYDAQGVHVIEKMIICFEENLISFIYDLVLENFLSLANNANGLCLTKKIIIHSKSELTIRKIQKIIVDNCLNLVQHSYGNYTIQTIFDHWDLSLCIPIIKLFFNRLCHLSMQKFSSNVVEKCFEKGGEIILSRFIDEIQGNNKVADLMKNNYGNYVVQKALKLAGEQNKRRIIELIIRNLDKLSEKKLVLKWRFIIQNYLQSLSQGNVYNPGLIPFDQSNYQFISQRNISDHY